MEGEALFIDTKGDFSVERAEDMAHTLNSQLSALKNQSLELHAKIKDHYKVTQILSRIRYIRIKDESQQILLHKMLGEILEQTPSLRLIVFDAFPSLLRASDLGYGERKKEICSSLNTFLRLAKDKKIAIVVVNFMKAGRKETQTGRDGAFQTSQPTPIFGEELF